MNMWRRGMALILVLVMLVPSVGARETVAYSDLFYGYSGEYLLSEELISYAVETSTAMEEICAAYMESPASFWSGVETAVSAMTHPSELAAVLGDLTGMTGFAYQNALDNANARLFSEVLRASDTERWLRKRLPGFVLFFEEFEAEWVREGVEQELLIDGYFSALRQEQLLHQVPDLTDVVEGVKEELPKCVTGTVKTVEALNAISLALLMEDVRLELLDQMLRVSPEGSVLRDGISRLRTQLILGFSSYFFENYVVKQLWQTLSDGVLLYMKNHTISGGLVTAILRVGDLVLFDLVFDVPTVDEVIEQIILTRYAQDLFGAVRDHVVVFETPFPVEAVEIHEELVNCLIAATNAGLAATSALTLSANEGRLAELVRRYQHYSYGTYCEAVMEKLAGIPVGKRKTKIFSQPWVMELGMEFRSPADELEKDCVYLFRGAIAGDVILRGDTMLGVEDGSGLTVFGSLTADRSGTRPHVPAGQRCTVAGQMTVETGAVVSNEGVLECGGLVVKEAYHTSSELQNHGLLTVAGDVLLGYCVTEAFSHRYGRLVQTKTDGAVQIGGDFLAEDPGCCLLSAGTVAFTGGEGHLVQNLACRDLKTQAELILLSDLFLTGRLSLGDGAIADSGYRVCMYDGASIAPGGGGYGSVCVRGSVELADVTVDDLTVESGALHIPHGTVTVNGTVSVCGGLTIGEDGSLRCAGLVDVYHGGAAVNAGMLQCGALTLRTTGSSCMLENKGAVIVDGDFFAQAQLGLMYQRYGVFLQDTPDASLTVRGEFSADDPACLRISGGSLTTGAMEAVEAMIQTIGTVTLDSRGAIALAERAYGQLSPVEQRYVRNGQTLLDAKARFAALVQLTEALEITEKWEGTALTLIFSNSGTETMPALHAVTAIYDQYGRFQTCGVQALTLGPQEKKEVTFSVGAEDRWGVFLLTPQFGLPLGSRMPWLRGQ